MNKNTNKLQDTNEYLKQKIDRLNSRVENLTTENISLKQKLDNYRKLLRDSYAEVRRIEKFVGLDIEEIKRNQSSNDSSFQTQIKTLDLSFLDNTMDY